MTPTDALTANLRREVLRLEDDLRARVEGQPEVLAAWQAEHRVAVERQRTAASWQIWRDERVTQAAVAWVLTTVFVRFCEDNGLVKPVWITGRGYRRQEALDAQLAYFRANPEHTDRDWLRQAVDYLARLPATAALVDPYSPLHLVSPSGDAAGALLAFWRARDDSGALLRDLTDPKLSTRFLGDLYQNLSESARDRYALLQTPEFVEEFILDRTLEPALRERPLDGFRVIDPACGSGHFLLGAFERLLDRWNQSAPALEVQARVQCALDAVHAVDLNPFAVAIARFRLVVAALKACGLRSLESAPAFRLNLAAGDSLLHGDQQLAFDVGRGFDSDSTLSGFTYSTEDLSKLREILQVGRYDVVVGNPPYITVKDKSLNQAYRERYLTCSGKYALTVPFMERFFQLARSGENAGWVGQIASNSFMKREFGAKLIEQFLSRQDLQLLVDTSGAYIPGHGTPTVILVGRARPPARSNVRAVLGVRGEPGRPVDPAKGFVWSNIVDRVDEPQYESEWISVSTFDRELFARHPWSLTGGGAITLSRRLENDATQLRKCVSGLGFAVVTGDDDAFATEAGSPRSWTWDQMRTQLFVPGETIRDWCIKSTGLIAFPYITRGTPDASVAWSRTYWPLRSWLRPGSAFGKTREQAGRAWFEYILPNWPRIDADLRISFAFFATHNHFVLERGGHVFNHSAPVLTFGPNTSTDYASGLLGLLNSSAACFWLKQNSHNKGVGGIGGGIGDEAWEPRYEFTGTTLKDFPLPATLPLARGRLLDSLAQQLGKSTPAAVCADARRTRATLDGAHGDYDRIRAEMIAQQEELDWEVYRLYGLLDDVLTYKGDDLPGLQPGERAFEIALARRMAAGEEESAWFTRHGSTTITEIPQHWPPAYQNLIQHRLDRIESDRNIRLLEKPEYKRRWAAEPWEKQEERAVSEWLLDRLEERRFWFDPHGRPTPKSVAQLADQVGRDHELASILALWEGRPDVPVERSLIRLIDGEAVPFLAAYRYREAGLRKREAWGHTWALQRREDNGEDVGTIPVPPRYTSADFTKTAYWSHRGKLDVPKERFIRYPDAGRATDPTPLLGWAGWDHAEQALALNVVITEREEEGWDDERLVPLVAGLAELQPWVDQWHSAIDPRYGVSMSAFLGEQLAQRAAQVSRTRDELKAWRPQPPSRGRRRALSRS